MNSSSKPFKSARSARKGDTRSILHGKKKGVLVALEEEKRVLGSAQ